MCASTAAIDRTSYSGNPGGSALFWRQLLALVDEGRVVPVIGPDAIVVDGPEGPEPITCLLARRVEILLELESTSSHPTLHDVACRWIKVAGTQRIADVYSAVRLALDEQPILVPPTLRKLAAIRAFDLFVSTTPDDLIRRAIDDERFGGERITKRFAYSPDSVQDLPAPVRQLDAPVVYHLLGRASTVPDFVVTEEDTLEFVHSLQSENRRPNRLLDELRSRSLLILGSGYAGWLARFFLRIARGERIFLARSKTEVVADARALSDTELLAFLSQFSAQTRVFGSTVDFVGELFERWQEYVASKPGGPAGRHSGTFSAKPDEREHAIFISYASEDRDAALALASALRVAKLPVWLDQQGRLEGGDDYELKIRRSIEAACLFVPVLSPNILTPQRRFFRQEWSIAGEVARRAAETMPFIVPVRIGDVPPDSAGIPDHIRRASWIDARPSGEDRFDTTVQRLRELYRQYLLTLRGGV
jgi:hypothetical protein